MKYFVISDIHSFYAEMRKALWKAGYRKTNKNHHLIVLGDVFDRGPGTIEVYEYLSSIPKSRLTLVKGNHEELYLELLRKNFPESHDFSNGTVKTFCQIANMPEGKLKWGPNNDPYEIWRIVKDRVRISSITRWIRNEKLWKHYVELGDFIGVHSFIPTKLCPDKVKFSMYFYDLPATCYEPWENWRTEATEADWSEAVWGCPYKQYQAGLFDLEKARGKRLICGHWHAYEFRQVLGGEKYTKKEDINFDPYISQDIIAIDACTVVSHQVNVLIIEENQVLN